MSQRIRSRSSLTLLAAVLLATALLTHVAPATHSQHIGPALLFFSSNTEEGLSLREAVDRIQTPAHARCRDLAGRILRDLSAGPATVHDAIGDWEDGVENSLLVVLPRSPDRDTLRLAAAWFGLIGDQKAVLAFHPDRHGNDVLVTLDVPGLLAEVRELLDQHGVRERTILVDANRCRVIILDQDGSRWQSLVAAAARMQARIESQRGRSELLAGPTRAEARKRYREVLRESRLASTTGRD
jgi:hypothetical protein